MGLRIAGLVLMFAGAVPATAQGGTDATSGIAWALISMNGKVVGRAAAERPPRLTAQCTKDTKGKLRFELLADAGDVPEVRFVTPFQPTDAQPFPPDVARATVIMEFLGYVKVKPVKRQWTGIDGLSGEWKYATPGSHSSNMEEIMFYLQYLKALPTLRLTLPDGAGKTVVMEFDTSGWQARVKAEPLCSASAL